MRAVAKTKTNNSPCLLTFCMEKQSENFPTSTVFFIPLPNRCVFWSQERGRVFENSRRTKVVWHGADFASGLQHFIFLRRAKFHGFKRTLTFSHAKATTKGPLEMSIRFGLFVQFLDEITGLNSALTFVLLSFRQVYFLKMFYFLVEMLINVLFPYCQFH